MNFELDEQMEWIESSDIIQIRYKYDMYIHYKNLDFLKADMIFLMLIKLTIYILQE